MSTPNTIPTLLAALVALVPTAQCAVTNEEPNLVSGDSSTVSVINGLYVIWAPGNSESCPTQSQVNS